MAANVNNKKGVCYLKDLKNDMQLKRQIPLKQLKIYSESSSQSKRNPKTTVIAEPSNSRNKPTAPKAATINPTPPSPLFTPVDPPVTGIATSTHYSRLRLTFHDFFLRSSFPSSQLHLEVGRELRSELPNFETNFRSSIDTWCDICNGVRKTDRFLRKYRTKDW